MVTTVPALLNTLLYAGIGIAVFVIGFVILDLLTPGKLWQEINEKQNRAVAQFAGAVAIGLAIIVAAAIHG
jgi:putative membrane protein